jgi:lysophospholipase L1-like esterase
MNGCHRSKYAAYPSVFAKASGAYLGARPSPDKSPSHFVACSGATVGNVGGVQQWPGETVGGQWNVANLATAGLVTITIGGNDVYFGAILGACYHDQSCNTYYDANGQQTANIANLLGPLYNTYLGLKKRAPLAQILVLTYPQVLAPDSDPKNPGFQGSHCPQGTKPPTLDGLDDQEQSWIRDRTSQLNSVIKKAASAAGAEVLDLETAFTATKHDICSNSPFVLGPVAAAVLGNPELYTFHPNVAGHGEIAARLEKCVEQKVCS